MRMSDWISDVCSSDLTLTEDALAVLPAGGDAALALSASRAAVLHIGPTGHDTLLLPLADLPVPAAERATLIRDLADAGRDLAAPLRGPFTRIKAAPPETARLAVKLAKQIGRASCRGRGCQYV